MVRTYQYTDGTLSTVRMRLKMIRIHRNIIPTQSLPPYLCSVDFLETRLAFRIPLAPAVRVWRGVAFSVSRDGIRSLANLPSLS